MSARYTILLVDDDKALLQLLAELLPENGEFATVEAETGKAALNALESHRFDLILLDVGLPDVDGRELCRQLRRNGVAVPIIMMTVLESKDDTVKGLDSGANDYVAKPFRLAELLARIRAHLRQHERSEDAIFTIGGYTFKPPSKLLVRANGADKVRLTEKETAILKYLYRARDRVVARDELLSEVWGYNAKVTTHTLETHIYRLRQKIEPDPSARRLLLTEAGGYRLVP